MKRKIILAGASGLIGGQAARILADQGHQVHCLLRRNDDGLPDSIKQIVAEPQLWAEQVTSLHAEVAISCLGTTMRIAGSKEAFAAVDLDLVTAFAAAVKQSGVSHFISVSSVGADPRSSNYYLATKGRAEDQISALGFARTDFIRPGLLRGNRGGPARVGEQIGIMLSPLADMLMMGSLSRYRSIKAETVASAIAALTAQTQQGNFIHENSGLENLAS